MESKSALAGFLVAPLIAALTSALSVVPEGFFCWVLLFYVLAFMAMSVFALPLFLLLHAWKLIRWWSCASSGLFIGGVIGWMLGSSTAGILDLLPFALTGAISALSFWAIWWLGTDEGLEALKSSYR